MPLFDNFDAECNKCMLNLFSEYLLALSGLIIG